jgi:hypothetical protein
LTEVRKIGVRRVGSAQLQNQTIVFMVDYDDGTVGELSLPVQAVPQMLELSHRAMFGQPSGRAMDLTVLRLGIGRTDKGQLLLKLDTAEAHSIVCTVNQAEVRHLTDRLENFDELPIARPLDRN